MSLQFIEPKAQFTEPKAQSIEAEVLNHPNWVMAKRALQEIKEALHAEHEDDQRYCPTFVCKLQSS